MNERVHTLKNLFDLGSKTGLFFLSISGFGIFASNTAFSADLQWKSFKAVGGGDGTACHYRDNDPNNNVQIVPNGGVVSFLFNTVGIYLNSATSALAHSMSCNVEAKVVVPRGYYVDTFGQFISVGVLKDAGTVGGISSNAFLFQKQIPINQLNLPFGGEAINEPQINKSNTQIFTKDQKRIMCLATAFSPLTTVFKFQVLAVGSRPNTQKMFVTQIDGTDVDVVTLNIAPSIKSCLTLL
jgi:hypothetical protein